MDKVDLAFRHFSLPAKANLLIQQCKEASDEICAYSDKPGGIPQFEPADGKMSWHLLNSVASQTLQGRTPNFCELGCGIGLVTLLASITGMQATGIEIEEELIDLAQGFSRQFALPATFINASIYPKDNTDSESAATVPPINYQQVDLFFAYPWPNEVVRIIELFRQVAASGAILICYHGGHNYRILRR